MNATDVREHLPVSIRGTDYGGRVRPMRRGFILDEKCKGPIHHVGPPFLVDPYGIVMVYVETLTPKMDQQGNRSPIRWAPLGCVFAHVRELVPTEEAD